MWPALGGGCGGDPVRTSPLSASKKHHTPPAPATRSAQMHIAVTCFAIAASRLRAGPRHTSPVVYPRWGVPAFGGTAAWDCPDATPSTRVVQRPVVVQPVIPLNARRYNALRAITSPRGYLSGPRPRSPRPPPIAGRPHTLRRRLARRRKPSATTPTWRPTRPASSSSVASLRR